MSEKTLKNIKKSLTSGIIYGVVFYIIHLMFYGKSSYLYSLAVASFATILFTCFLFAHFTLTEKKYLTAVENMKKEKDVLFEGMASIYIRGASFAGWLFLTQTELIFVVYKKNVKSEEVILQLEDITEVTVSKRMGFSTNGFVLALKQGYLAKFIVSDITLWVDKINERIK